MCVCVYSNSLFMDSIVRAFLSFVVCNVYGCVFASEKKNNPPMYNLFMYRESPILRGNCPNSAPLSTPNFMGGTHEDKHKQEDDCRGDVDDEQVDKSSGTPQSSTSSIYLSNHILRKAQV